MLQVDPEAGVSLRSSNRSSSCSRESAARNRLSSHSAVCSERAAAHDLGSSAKSPATELPEEVIERKSHAVPIDQVGV